MWQIMGVPISGYDAKGRSSLDKTENVNPVHVNNLIILLPVIAITFDFDQINV